MPEESHSALHQGQMGEESPQLSSTVPNLDHSRGNFDLATYVANQICKEPLEKEDQRPVSLVSTLSSGSSRDSRSLFGSSVALSPPTTPLAHSEEDIDLELSPAEVTGQQAGYQSPILTKSRRLWREQLDPTENCNQWNSNHTHPGGRAASEVIQVPSSPVITDTMAPNPKLTYVDRVVMEIIETERMYVKDLHSIVEDYLAHIIDMSNLPIRPEQVCALFGNIEDIYEFNSELLQTLDMCESDAVAVAQCFVDKSEYFEIYTQYCNNYPNSVATLTDCMRSKTLAKFFRDRQAALKRSLPLGSYLLKPVQRILKYRLLLQEIAKHFNPDEEGYEVVQEALDTMTGVAWYINDMKRKHEHAVRVQEIQSLLINWKGPDLTTYGELVLEGTFQVLRAKNTRTLFLFEKMLLITKKRGENYVYKIHISCSTLMLLDSAKDPLLFSVIHFKRPKQPHTVKAKSVEEKRLWSHHIKRLILENHSTILPQKAKDVTLEHSSYPPKNQSSPKRLMKAESCQAVDFYLAGRNGRRRSEPAKQIIRSSKDAAVLKHADSEGALLGERTALQPGGSVSTLTSSLDEPRAEKPRAEYQTPRDSAEHPSPSASERKLSRSPSEGAAEQDDVLIGSDQVADFASSVLAAISCWHYKARALLSTHFTTDDQDGEITERKTSPEHAERSSQEENKDSYVSVKEALNTQVDRQKFHPVNDVPVFGENHKLETDSSLDSEPPPFASEQEAEMPRSVDSSREREEEESYSYDPSTADTSAQTNRELSDVEDDSLSASGSVSASCAMDQGCETTGQSFSSEDSRRAEELSSLAQPQVDGHTSEEPSAHVNSEKHVPHTTELLPEPTPKVTPSVPVFMPNIPEGKGRSTLSKRDQLLIHKIRRYYEHAENQDASFCIKRRESLSYIPAGLVRHLSRQLNGISTHHPVAIHKRSPLKSRPTSWSVFNLPALEKGENTETSGQQIPPGSTVKPQIPKQEEFRPSSEMVRVWEDMEAEEECGELSQAAEGTNYFGEVDVFGKVVLPQPVQMSETEASIGSTTSSTSAPTIGLTAEGRRSSQDNNFHPSHLPSIISLRGSIDEDQILQDMGRMRNKVFQLARQYSQRIKNNKPAAWQRGRQPTGQEAQRSTAASHEEKLKERDKLSFRLQLNACSHAVIHEVPCATPVLTSSKPISQDVPSPQTPVLESFHWPDVQELRSKYSETSHPPRDSCDCANAIHEADCNLCSGPSDSLESPTNWCTSLCSSTCSENHTVLEDLSQHQAHFPTSKLSCSEHMLDSLLPQEAQHTEEPVQSSGLHDEDCLLQQSLNSDTSDVARAGKNSEMKRVKSLLEKFQSLSTG